MKREREESGAGRIVCVRGKMYVGLLARVWDDKTSKDRREVSGTVNEVE